MATAYRIWEMLDRSRTGPFMDEDDFLVVVGREKALLISEDGEKYSPEEIEEFVSVFMGHHRSYCSTGVRTGRWNRVLEKSLVTD